MRERAFSCIKVSIGVQRIHRGGRFEAAA
jgi:hypothetical protein